MVLSNEMSLTDAIAQLQQKGIAVALLEVRKSGTGRMAARHSSGRLLDALPGTAVISNASNTFRYNLCLICE